MIPKGRFDISASGNKKNILCKQKKTALKGHSTEWQFSPAKKL